MKDLSEKTNPPESAMANLIAAIKAELQLQQPLPMVLDAKEAAAYIKVSYWKFTIMAKNGEVPHWREGSRIFCRREELDEWMHQRIRDNMKQFEKPKMRRVK